MIIFHFRLAFFYALACPLLGIQYSLQIPQYKMPRINGHLLGMNEAFGKIDINEESEFDRVSNTLTSISQAHRVITRTLSTKMTETVGKLLNHTLSADLVSLNTLLRTSNGIILNTTNPLQQKLNSLSGAPVDELRDGLRESRLEVVKSLGDLLPVLCDIQRNQAGKMDVEARDGATEVINSIRAAADEVTLVKCRGKDCVRHLFPAALEVKLMANCHDSNKPFVLPFGD